MQQINNLTLWLQTKKTTNKKIKEHLETNDKQKTNNKKPKQKKNKTEPPLNKKTRIAGKIMPWKRNKCK